jgi:drug/metabolite transporter (DMT)-like permease
MSDPRRKLLSTPLEGAICGLVGAALFGASAPVAKILLPGFSPISLAGLLYAGAGLGLTLYRGGVRMLREGDDSHEAHLRKSDLPLIAGIVIAGGVAGPILMLIGLERLSAVASSLLLNLEGVFTIAIAMLLFGEHLGEREAIGAAAVLAGALLLTYRPGDMRGDLVGALAIAGACMSWGLDNNLTQRLSIRNPAAIVQTKTLGAGALTLIVALLTNQPFGDGLHIVYALLVGSMSYGASIVLDTYALRLLGAAREAAFFATAPFVGAILAVPLAGETPTFWDVAGGVVMVGGVAWLLFFRHAHTHTHEPLEHDHAHVHDEHHPHVHPEGTTEPHTHWHRHEPLTHAHEHADDVHHRHRH